MKMSRPVVDLTFLVVGVHLLLGAQTQFQDNSCDVNIPSRPIPAVTEFGRAYALSDIQPTVCGEGEYLDWISCKPCEEGTFMTRKMAETKRYPFCQKCYQPEMYEIVEEKCTKTRDAKIMCEDGYYRCGVPGKPCQSECRRCDVCGLGINMFLNYEVRSCSGDQNTVCCKWENMILVNGSCVVKTTVATSTRHLETTTVSFSTTADRQINKSRNSVTNTASVLPKNSQPHWSGLFLLLVFDLRLVIM